MFAFFLDRNMINEEVIQSFRDLTGENIYDVTPTFVKQFGDRYMDQKKVLNKAVGKEVVCH